MPLREQSLKESGLVPVDIQLKLNDSAVFGSEFVGPAESSSDGIRRPSALFRSHNGTRRKGFRGLSRFVRFLDEPEEPEIKPGLCLALLEYLSNEVWTTEVGSSETTIWLKTLNMSLIKSKSYQDVPGAGSPGVSRGPEYPQRSQWMKRDGRPEGINAHALECAHFGPVLYESAIPVAYQGFA